MSGEPIWSITIQGEPVPASRPRVTARHGTYTPARYRTWKREASLLCRASWGRAEAITSAVAVLVEVTLPRPASKPAKGTLHRAYWHPTEDYPLPLRGDADNYAKAALDALQQGRVIADDRQIVELTVTKCAGSAPGVSITLSLVEPEWADPSEVAAK